MAKMKNKTKLILIIFLITFAVLACNIPEMGKNLDDELSELDDGDFPTQDTISSKTVESNPEIDKSEIQAQHPININPDKRIQPENLTYLGAFKLPEDPGWEYSGHGLTYYPNGDPGGDGDGYPGSLFGVGHDQQQHVSEISIPVPLVSKNLENLNSATTLQPFSDLTGGIFIAEEMTIPRSGIAYLEPQGKQTTAKLHFAWGQHFQEFEASHGWAELDLSNPESAGAWVFGVHTNYVTNDYLLAIPQEWAETYTPGMLLATGRAREGPWSGRGPALFAYSPWKDGNPPAPQEILRSITPLLLYGVSDPNLPEIQGDDSMGMEGYRDADHWSGGAWLTAEDRGAVVFVGTKAIGKEWYGFANGVVWAHDCAEQNDCPEPPEWPFDDRGFWAEDYQAQIIFFDPAELASVATGQMKSWEPQPYATLVIDNVLFDSDLDFEEYKRDLVAAAAFDRENRLLYMIERLADEYRSVIHVWRID